MRERIEYIQQAISIRIGLPAEELCRTWEECATWKNLPEKEFMSKYGDAVLEKYNMPTAEEIERIWQYDEDPDIDDDKDDEDESDNKSDNMSDIY